MPCYFFSDHLIAHIILPEQKTDFLKYMMLFFCQYRVAGCLLKVFSKTTTLIMVMTMIVLPEY